MKITRASTVDTVHAFASDLLNVSFGLSPDSSNCFSSYNLSQTVLEWAKNATSAQLMANALLGIYLPALHSSDSSNAASYLDEYAQPRAFLVCADDVLVEEGYQATPGTATCPPITPSSPASTALAAIIGGSVGGGFSVLLLLLACLWRRQHRRDTRQKLFLQMQTTSSSAALSATSSMSDVNRIRSAGPCM